MERPRDGAKKIDGWIDDAPFSDFLTHLPFFMDQFRDSMLREGKTEMHRAVLRVESRI